MLEHKKLHLFDNEHELFPNVFVKLYNGHTDGQVIPIITVDGQAFAYTADLFPSTAHLPMPYVMSYDTRPLLTLEDRESFFKDAMKNNYILFFEHDLYNECCTLQETEKGIRAKDTFSLDAYFKRKWTTPLQVDGVIIYFFASSNHTLQATGNYTQKRLKLGQSRLKN